MRSLKLALLATAATAVLSSAAFAADLIVDQPTMAPVVDNSFTWDGAYIGAFIQGQSAPAAFGLGLLVGICQFPCMGGPYLMVIGLLHDQVTYWSGFGYLFLYNLILILPLAAVLYVSADKVIVGKVQEWKRSNMKGFRFWAGLAMVAIGILILFI